ncbi:hypothetical protein RF074_14610, partial [Serratia marcescens]|uniref:hypothetical protein n=1 Tax=Serratia marcescens TaxID=615 RepID=UPI00281306ED
MNEVDARGSAESHENETETVGARILSPVPSKETETDIPPKAVILLVPVSPILNADHTLNSKPEVVEVVNTTV